ncbi:alpha/beta fold hydrolase [Paraburkholderia acidipaludis]|uniref:alpha/beta fold hydrolase n=1 Tax=Paraburkholderia acidipaludis TaxID=660537 RepID=UPI0004806887|nr:alpha/beta fold hydrolase [Paraburkholderia acidipaludis]
MSASGGALAESEVLAGGVLTHYATAGTTGPAVLLVHGRGIGASGATEWHRLLPLLGRAGFRAYAPDHLAMGWTDLRPHAWPVNGYESLIGHMLAFLDAMQIERAFVIGNSMGAYVAARLAIDEPRRVAALTMIGSNTLAAALGLIPAPVPAMPREEDWQREGIRRQLRMQFAEPSALPEAMLDQRVAAAQRPGVREATAALIGALRARAGDETARAAFPIGDSLPKLRIPMQLIWGEHDHVAPVALVHQIAALLPALPCSVIPDAGHLCHIESADAVADSIVRFLRQIAFR